jgi:serine/threonine-protein kinase
MPDRMPSPWDSMTIDFQTEEGRAFYQARLAFLGKAGFLLTMAILLMQVAVAPFVFAGVPHDTHGLALQIARRLVFLVVWVVCREGRVPLGLLRVLDALLPFAACFGIAVQGTLWPSQIPGQEWAAVLAVTTVTVGRAVFVPSTASRTLWIGLFAAVPVAAVAVLHPSTAEATLGGGPLVAMSAIVWSLCAIAISTGASATIYSLRRQVTEARHVGPYTLGRKLGEGAMGVVYEARHAMLRRPTAVKLLPAEKAGEANIQRFEREVQITAQLSHPNTISIFDYGRTPDGVFFYAMEYLEGVNLEELVKEFGPQPPARAVHILRQVAGSLAEAHQAGLIHRDIKPANILLCQRGGAADVAKVLDFGLARDVDGASAAAITQVDAIAGTPLYLAPEAIEDARSVDGRSDIYALGAVAYYLLTGTTVFKAGNIVDVCRQHLFTRPVPPSHRLGRPLPADLERLVLACLEKDPEHRPQSAIELSQLLHGCQVGAWGEEAAREWWTGHDSRVRSIRDGARRPARPSALSWSSLAGETPVAWPGRLRLSPEAGSSTLARA